MSVVDLVQVDRFHADVPVCVSGAADRQRKAFGGQKDNESIQASILKLALQLAFHVGCSLGGDQGTGGGSMGYFPRLLRIPGRLVHVWKTNMV